MVPKEAYLTRLARKARLLLPDALDHIPSTQEMEQSDDQIAKSIVQQHAEGSVLLGAGQFEITRDLVSDEEITAS